MRAFLDERQVLHDPRHFMANGALLPNPEVPARVGILHAAAEDAGCNFDTPNDAGPGPIAAIHTSEYLVFLRRIHSRWCRIEGASDEVIPNIHPANRSDSYPLSAVGQAGYHQADTACPISAETWEAAYWSAQTAIAAADAVAGQDRVVYALSRPPGHHAFADLAGGFCFLNNSAIAAERLLSSGMRPAVLDIDVHHGNGTQGIFYSRGDVLTVSLHADPTRFYPFFWGHAQERGEGAGLGANLNLPLQRGCDDDTYLRALGKALERIEAFDADVIVVALGLDNHVDDPFEGFAITTRGFARIGEAIAATGRPLVLVQEGGYVSDALGANLTSFLNGLRT